MNHLTSPQHNIKMFIIATAVLTIIFAKLFFFEKPFRVSMTCDKCEAVMETLLKAIENDKVVLDESALSYQLEEAPKYLLKLIYHACDTHFFENGDVNDILVCRVYLNSALGFIAKSLKMNQTTNYICNFNSHGCYENATVIED
uniref:Saposin B-type domain-containing protein n=1 Tax=Panagrellus redivivus TaxID=6233 RepID=A0A7E4W3M4_PANRE